MLDYNRFSVYTSAFMSIVGLLVSYSCLGWSIYRLWTGYITAGTLMMFISMANSLTTAFRALVQLVPQAINATTCAGRLMTVSELKKEDVEEEVAVTAVKEVAEKGVSVSLREVDVIYREGNQVLESGFFVADPGQVVAIIGPSGEGKTTLMRILLGLIAPKSGVAELITKDGKIKAVYNALKAYQDMPVWRYDATYWQRLMSGDAVSAIVDGLGYVFCIFVIFGMWYLSVLFIRPMFALGLKEYIKEYSLCYQLIPFVKSMWNKLVEETKHIDFSEKSVRTVMKLVVINFIVLSLCSMMWFSEFYSSLFIRLYCSS